MVTKSGKRLPADKKLQGAPSVLYDAVAILPSQEGIKALSQSAAARQFVSDVFNHLKFIGYTNEVKLLFEKANIFSELDKGCIEFSDTNDIKTFISKCHKIRFWERESRIVP